MKRLAFDLCMITFDAALGAYWVAHGHPWLGAIGFAVAGFCAGLSVADMMARKVFLGRWLL